MSESKRLRFDVIVAGAGLWGCVMARRLAEAERRVLVLERRKAVGGNCRCRTEGGIEVHLYGSHIFHTANEDVWRFVNRFAAFNDYRHQVLARCRGRIYHLPIGRTLVREFFGRDIAPSALSESERAALFDAFIRGYTSKQWGIDPDNVDPSVIARLKVRDSDSVDYFDDPHQGIPKEGYNALFESMLRHENISVRTNCDFTLGGRRPSVPVFYSGPIDRLFGFKHGCLPWRTLRFETEHLSCRDYQHAAVVNYSDVSDPYTRIHEFRHYHPEGDGPFAKPQGTIITREYSSAWQKGDEPYYPIDTEASRNLLSKYQAEVRAYNDRFASESNPVPLTVGGRLGSYAYYDMDKSIAAALAVDIAT